MRSPNFASGNAPEVPFTKPGKRTAVAEAISGLLEPPKVYVVRAGDTWESIARAIGLENGNFLVVNLFATKPENLVGITISYHKASRKLVIGHTGDHATVVSIPPSVQTILPGANDGFYGDKRLVA